jgi:hypothetical protein
MTRQSATIRAQRRNNSFNLCSFSNSGDILLSKVDEDSPEGARLCNWGSQLQELQHCTTCLEDSNQYSMFRLFKAWTPRVSRANERNSQALKLNKHQTHFPLRYTLQNQLALACKCDRSFARYYFLIAGQALEIVVQTTRSLRPSFALLQTLT